MHLDSENWLKGSIVTRKLRVFRDFWGLTPGFTPQLWDGDL